MTCIARWLAYLGGLTLLAAAVMVAIDVLARATFGTVPLRSFEISTYVFAAATAFGFAYALIERKHIRIDAVYNTLPAVSRPYLDLAALTSLGLCAGVLAYHAALTALDSFELGATSTTTLQVPLALPQGLWALGLVWFAVTAAYLLVQCIVDLMTGRTDALATRIGMPGEQQDV